GTIRGGCLDPLARCGQLAGVRQGEVDGRRALPLIESDGAQRYRVAGLEDGRDVQPARRGQREKRTVAVAEAVKPEPDRFRRRAGLVTRVDADRVEPEKVAGLHWNAGPEGIEEPRLRDRMRPVMAHDLEHVVAHVAEDLHRYLLPAPRRGAVAPGR